MEMSQLVHYVEMLVADYKASERVPHFEAIIMILHWKSQQVFSTGGPGALGSCKGGLEVMGSFLKMISEVKHTNICTENILKSTLKSSIMKYLKYFVF